MNKQQPMSTKIKNEPKTKKEGGGGGVVKELPHYRALEEFVNKGKTVVDFYRTDCGPCADFAPTYKQLSGTWSGKIAFAKMNLQTVDGADDLITMYNLQSVPTFVLFRNGTEQARLDEADEGRLVTLLTRL